MATKRVRYLSSTRVEGLTFEILRRVIAEDGTVTLTLKGPEGTVFDRVVSDELMERFGYTLTVEDKDDAN